MFIYPWGMGDCGKRETEGGVWGGSMIKWTQGLNGNEHDETEGEGMRATSVLCGLGGNCQPKSQRHPPPQPPQGTDRGLGEAMWDSFMEADPQKRGDLEIQSRF